MKNIIERKFLGLVLFVLLQMIIVSAQACEESPEQLSIDVENATQMGEDSDNYFIYIPKDGEDPITVTITGSGDIPCPTTEEQCECDEETEAPEAEDDIEFTFEHTVGTQDPEDDSKISWEITSGTAPGEYKFKLTEIKQGYECPEGFSGGVDSKSNTQESREISVWVISVELTGVGYTEDHMITEYLSNTQIDPDGQTFVWTKETNPAHPVAYTKDQAPTAFGRIVIEPSNFPTTEGTLKVKEDGSEVASEGSMNFDGGDNDFSDLSFSGKLPNRVATEEIEYEWFVSLYGEEVTTGSSTTTFHLTADTPSISPLYDLALEKACDYVDGAEDYAGAINSGIGNDNEVYYHPNVSFRPHVLEAYSEAVGCFDNAGLMIYLLDSIGAPNGNLELYWGGTASNQASKYYYHHSPTEWARATTRCIRPVKDSAPENPRFTFHALVELNGIRYDPSYGEVGVPEFTEFAPADIQVDPNQPFPSPGDSDWNRNEHLDPAASLQVGSLADYLENEEDYYCVAPNWDPVLGM